ncbi:hypothetical protein B0H14DRAFT_3901566 [Mycena olivaceomarginata]|nr:hypothetical protein B0H14DRAFT_3901566 [Mycena olivaceomarginata]
MADVVQLVVVLVILWVVDVRSYSLRDNWREIELTRMKREPANMYDDEPRSTLVTELPDPLTFDPNKTNASWFHRETRGFTRFPAHFTRIHSLATAYMLALASSLVVHVLALLYFLAVPVAVHRLANASVQVPRLPVFAAVSSHPSTEHGLTSSQGPQRDARPRRAAHVRAGEGARCAMIVDLALSPHGEPADRLRPPYRTPPFTLSLDLHNLIL